jgi:hypothetical protein
LSSCFFPIARFVLFVVCTSVYGVPYVGNMYSMYIVMMSTKEAI